MTFLRPVFSDDRIRIFKCTILQQKITKAARLIQTLMEVDTRESVKSFRRFGVRAFGGRSMGAGNLRGLHLGDAHGPPLQSDEERDVVAFDLLNER